MTFLVQYLLKKVKFNFLTFSELYKSGLVENHYELNFSMNS